MYTVYIHSHNYFPNLTEVRGEVKMTISGSNVDTMQGSLAPQTSAPSCFDKSRVIKE